MNAGTLSRVRRVGAGPTARCSSSTGDHEQLLLTRCHRVLKVINPATEELLAELEEDDADTLARRTAPTRAAQPAWARTPLAERLAADRRFRALLQSRRDTLARTLTAEVGKPIRQSRNELNGLLARIDFFLASTRGRCAEEEVVRRRRTPRSRSGSRTSRSAWSPTSRPGTIRTSSAPTCSCPRCSPATPCSTSRRSSPR